MDVLAIDIETYSSNDITNSVYKYVEADDFQILLFAYAFNDDDVKVVDLTKEELPDRVLEALTSKDVLKTAFNANFEKVCLKKVYPNTDIDNWQCTMVMARYNALPGSLDKAAKVLKLVNQKDFKGKDLIRYFSNPCKPTKANGGRTRNLPKHDIEKWQMFKDYCAQDVEVEREIRRKLLPYTLSDKEWEIWKVDQAVNNNGIAVDQVLVDSAIAIDEYEKKRLIAEAREITGLSNPNSVAQLKQWLSDELGRDITGVTKAVIKELLAEDVPEHVKRVLKIRSMTGRTSAKKYQAIKDSACLDNRCRGMFQFCGASRTARWSGRIVQLQNLRRNNLKNITGARKLVTIGDYDLLKLFYGDVSDVLSQLIRTAFVAPKGSRFIIADYSAIEARVIAWLAKEKWRQDVFASTGKIYEASASMMFGVPMEKIVKGNPEYGLRQKGKVAELALGYQGGTGALISMGAVKGGIAEDELPDIVARWRKASPNIVKFWYDVDAAAKTAIKEMTRVTIKQGNIEFYMDNGALFIKLPSGRTLTYAGARIGENRFGGESITYKGMNQTTSKWEKLETYGGKLVENIVQAVARDCLAWAMVRLHNAGYKIVAHVHDEVIIEANKGSLDDVINIMCEAEEWNKGLILNAAGFESSFYMKD